MKYLKRHNESIIYDGNLLEELIGMFKDNFLSLNDEADIRMSCCYSNYIVGSKQLQTVDFTYSYRDSKCEFRKGMKSQEEIFYTKGIKNDEFDKFMDENTKKFRLVFKVEIDIIPEDDDNGLTIEGGQTIIDVDKVCKNMKFISEELPMVISRLKDEFEEVIVNVSTIGSCIEVNAFCDKETTKKVGLIPYLLSHKWMNIKI